MPTCKNPINKIYLDEVQRLTENPDLIEKSWSDAEPLFKFVSPNQKTGNYCGCLTMIRGDRLRIAIDKSGHNADINLTNMIYSDERLPDRADNIKVEHLMVFAEWQQFLDEYYERKAGV